MRSFLGVKALRKYPQAATVQPQKYPPAISPTIHRAQGEKKNGTVVARHTPMPTIIRPLAATLLLISRPHVRRPKKCAIIAANI